jgi:WD40 repeat protein
MRGAIVTGLTTLYLKPTDYMLIASDSDGRLAVINLLGQDNKKIAGELSVERIFQGYHGLLEDRERGPAIFSLACYEKEGILISGGEDCTLRVWGLLSHSKKNARVGGHSSCVTDMQVVGEALVTAEELGAVHMWRILSTSTDPSVSLHKLYSWPALSPSPSTDLFSLPSTKAIISSLLVQGEVYMSHSAENAEYTDIWKIQWYSAELSDVDADCRVVVTQLTCLSHEAFKITSANLNLFDSSNPLSRNRIFLGTTQGSILKFLI